MTTAAPTLLSRAAPSGWLYGPAVDLLCGSGLGYLLSVPLLVALASATGVAQFPEWIATLLAVAVTTPHYGATRLRVYEDGRDRRKYAFFAVHATVMVGLAFVWGLFDPWVGSLLVTAYVTWSPWHFAGQNYGLALMFLRRQQIEVGPTLKRLVYASFVLSFMLAFLAIHVEQSALVYAAGTEDDSQTFTVLRLGLPHYVAGPLMLILAIAYVGTLVAAARMLRRQTTFRMLVPAGMLVLTQALWFAIPAVASVFGGHPLSTLPFSAIWISAAHAVQYLWVTAYYAKRSDSSTPAPAFLTKSLLAGSALGLFPLLLFAPGLLGSWVATSTGVGVLLFAVLNLHHFILDGAIWKLRDGRVARVLLRTDLEVADDSAVAAPRGRHWIRRAVWTLGVVSLVFPAYVWWEVWGGISTDLARAEIAARRLAWLGRESAPVLGNLGWLYERAGRGEAAIAT